MRNYRKSSILFLLILFLLIGGVIAKEINVNANEITEAKGYELEEGDSFIINYENNDGKSVPFQFPNLQKTSSNKLSFRLNKKGKIIEAHFKSSVDKKYPLGNQLVSVPKGSEVDFIEGNANIKMPADSKVVAASVITSGEDPDSVINYQSANGRFTLENGNFFVFHKNNDGILKYDGNFYFDKGLATMNHMQIVNDGIKTYVDFKGAINGDYNGAYISMKDGTFVTGSNIDVFGPKINFLEGNPYGLRVKSGDHVAVQALGHPQGNFVKIVNRDKQGLIPKVDHLNEFAMNVDGKTVHYNSNFGKLYLSPKTLIQGFTTEESSVPVEIHSFKTENGRIGKVSKVGNVLGITDNVEFAYGSNPGFIQTTSGYSKGFSSLKKGFSNSWLYYNIRNVNDINRFLRKGVTVSDSTGRLNNPKNAKWVTDLLAGLPREVYNRLDTVRFKGGVYHKGRSVGGLAGNNGQGDVQIALSNFGPETVRHEITHTFQFRGPKGFWRDWKSVGYTPPGRYVNGATQGFAWGYGGTSWHEDGATYGDKIYKPNYWKNLISSNNKYHKIYRGKLAVLKKHNAITQTEYSAIMNVRGLDSSSSSIQKYINAARGFVRG